MADRLISLGSLANYQATLYKSFVQYNSSNSIKVLAGTYNIDGYLRKINQDQVVNPNNLSGGKYYSIYLTIRNNNPQIANIEVKDEPNLPDSTGLIAYSKIGGFRTDAGGNIISSSVYGKNIDNLGKVQQLIGEGNIYSYEPSIEATRNFITIPNNSNLIWWKTFNKIEDPDPPGTPVLFTIPKTGKYLIELSIDMYMISNNNIHGAHLLFCFTYDTCDTVGTALDKAPATCNGNFYLLTNSGGVHWSQPCYGGHFYIKDIVNFTSTSLYATFGICDHISNTTHLVAYKDLKSGTIILRLVDLD